MLGRIVRDYEHWMPSAVQNEMNTVLTKEHKRLRKQKADAKAPARAGLVVSVDEPSLTINTGKVAYNPIYWSDVPIILLQVGIIVILYNIFGDWGILSSS